MSALAHLIPADFAKRHLRTGRELVKARRQERPEGRLPTGSEVFDRLLGGGLERGTLVELSGRGGGRFSLVLGALAAATAGGDAAALIDLGDALDPQAALDAGVVLERLLWARPRRLKEALLAIEAVLATAMPLVVFDLGLPPVPGGRGAEASWLRLARAAQEQRVALLVSSPYRVSATAAHAVVEMRLRRASWSGRGARPRLLTGLDGRLDLVKGRGCHDAEPAHLELRAPSPVATSPSPESTTSQGSEAPREGAARPFDPKTAALGPRPLPARDPARRAIA